MLSVKSCYSSTHIICLYISPTEMNSQQAHLPPSLSYIHGKKLAESDSSETLCRVSISCVGTPPGFEILTLDDNASL